MQTVLHSTATISGQKPFTAVVSRERLGRSSRLNVRQAVTASETQTSSKETIYLGKGKTIVDDPSKYPSRNEYVGGWAGGETGLKQFIADVKNEKYSNKKAPFSPGTTLISIGNKKVPAVKTGQGKDPIYVGYSKDDIDLRKSGKPGRFLIDDARKYPSRNELTGGFAGGEAGLKTFVATGDIKLADQSRPGRNNPLIVAGTVSVSATLGAILLTNVEEVVAGVASGDGKVELALTAVDDSTRLLLGAAIGLLGIVGVVAGGRALAKSASDGARKD